MADELQGKKIAFPMANEGVEEVELTKPLADVVKGRKDTSWPSLETDLRNAGAEWVAERIHAGQAA